jgi:tetratricopeptide (TPR) repeat protein
MRRSMLKGALLVAGACWFSMASATEENARALHDRAVTAYREARYADAIDLFRRAHAIEPHPELAYNLGQALEKAGDLPAAIESFREYLRLAPKAEDRPVVEARITNLERKLQAMWAKLRVTSTPPGAKLEIDGKPVGTTPWAGALPAGTHEAKLRLSGHRDSARSVVLIAGRNADLGITLEPHAPEGSPSTPPPGKVVADEPSTASIGVGTYVAFGVGAAALGAALGFELARRGAEDDARSARTQLEHQASVEDAEGHRDLARVFAGVGAAAVITGGVLLYFDLSGPGRERESAGLGIGVGGLGHGGFGITGATWF